MIDDQVSAPSRPRELTDASFLLATGLLALLGFHGAFGGQTYLLVGASALVIGIALALLGTRTGQPFLVVLLVAAIVAVLFGAGIALRDTAVAGVLPSIDTAKSLGNAGLYGWKQLLTTVRPVGDVGDLLAIPYLLGLTMGVLGHTLSSRERPLWLPALPVLAVAALSILLGSPEPTAAFLQGALLSGILLAWLSVRYARGVSSQVRTAGRFGRPAMAAVLLAVAVGGGWVVGPHLPGASKHERVVLHVVPPFDPGKYPSPLAAFRKYVPDTPLSQSKEALFSVVGAPAGTPLRVATMDEYDGLVWGVSNGSKGRNELPGYARIGGVLPSELKGEEHKLTVTPADDWNQVWLPTAGDVTSLTFDGARASELAEEVRFSLQTESGVVPSRLTSADPYSISYVQKPEPDLAALAKANPEGTPVLMPEVEAAFRPVAQKMAGGATTPVQRSLAIAAYLKSVGKYSNGNDEFLAEPGHGLGRLLTFLQSKQIVGNDEQYAAAMAVLAETAGVPARVVLGSLLPASGVVTGNDMTAWVELDLAETGWTRLPTTAFSPKRDKKPEPQPKEKPQPPPPAYIAPPLQKPLVTGLSASEVDTTARTAVRDQLQKDASSLLPHWLKVALKVTLIPLLLVAAVMGSILLLKDVRRRRRRTRGSPARRIAGGWAEILDAAADFGFPAVKGGTRREQAHSVSGLSLLAAAKNADAVVFGPGALEDESATRYWQQVESARSSFVEGLSRWQRLKVAVSLKSLRPSRRFAPVEVRP